MRTAYPVSLLEFEVTETAFVINKQLAFSVLHHLQKWGSVLRWMTLAPVTPPEHAARFSFRRHQTRPQLYDRCGEQPSGTLIRASHYFAGQFDQYAAYRRGVETADNCRSEEEGCDEMQGFLFGEPVDIKHLPDRR